MDLESKLFRVLRELARTLNGCALLDVLEDLRIARLIAHDEQTAPGFFLGFQGFVVGGDARRAGPRKIQRLQLAAKLNGARLLDVEGVIVKEIFLHVWPVLFGFGHLAGHGIGRTLAPGMTAQSLRPETESTLRRAAARGIQRDKRI